MVKQKSAELPKELKESVNKVWLAGLGALALAEEEGSKLFKSLVKKGEEYEVRGKAEIGKEFGKLKDIVVEVRGKAGRAIEEVSGKVGDKVDDQVTAALARLGVPSKDEIATLTARVEELTTLVEKLKAPKATKSTTRG
ncbi:MAG: phasin family protein [Holophagales bacterium]|nr:MAG: phasin family protein [Holophagales bacterium]